MFISRGISEKRLFSQLSGVSTIPVIVKGQGVLNNSYPEYYLFNDGVGGGSHTSGKSYDAYGANNYVKHIEQTGIGQTYFMQLIDTTNFKWLTAIWQCNGNAAAFNNTIGIIPASLGDPNSICSAVPAGTNLHTYYSGQGILRIHTCMAMPGSLYLDKADVSAYQGLYYFYMEAMAQDGTSTSKYAQTTIYDLLLQV